jgi:molybdopterin-guanine dinucleotide biosynthesis protein A
LRKFLLDPASLPAVILAGGRSRRMGSEKALVTLGGETMLARVSQRLGRQVMDVALNADRDFPLASDLRLVPDTVAGKAGPLAGVLAALRDTEAGHPWATHVATVPVDTPFFPPNFIRSLSQAIGTKHEIAIATSGGRDHPVFGLWPVAVADDLDDWLRRDERRRVRDFLLRHDVRRVDFSMVETPSGAFDPFFNINTPGDLAVARQWLEVLAE